MSSVATLVCMHCNKEFEVSSCKKSKAIYEYKKYNKRYFCCMECRLAARGQQKRVEVECTNCGKVFVPTSSKKKRCSENRFCCQSCATTYNNRNKTHGNRRSQLEDYLENVLKNEFSHLEMLFNDKSTIGSELDIYIPSLKLAFEINGIFHYKPIYGEDKFNKTVENDELKKHNCEKNGIELVVIDTTKQKKFSEESSQKFLKIIRSKINEVFRTSL